jgi:hypothetical protein
MLTHTTSNTNNNITTALCLGLSPRTWSVVSDWRGSPPQKVIGSTIPRRRSRAPSSRRLGFENQIRTWRPLPRATRTGTALRRSRPWWPSSNRLLSLATKRSVSWSTRPHNWRNSSNRLRPRPLIGGSGVKIIASRWDMFAHVIVIVAKQTKTPQKSQIPRPKSAVSVSPLKPSPARAASPAAAAPAAASSLSPSRLPPSATASMAAASPQPPLAEAASGTGYVCRQWMCR